MKTTMKLAVAAMMASGLSACATQQVGRPEVRASVGSSAEPQRTAYAGAGCMTVSARSKVQAENVSDGRLRLRFDLPLSVYGAFVTEARLIVHRASDHATLQSDVTDAARGWALGLADEDGVILSHRNVVTSETELVNERPVLVICATR
jgi:hypothetical protein